MYKILAHSGEGAYDNMMTGDWSHNGGATMFWVPVLVLAIITATVYLLAHRSKQSDHSRNHNPMAIAKTRYAKGEITKQQFDEIKRDIA